MTLLEDLRSRDRPLSENDDESERRERYGVDILPLNERREMNPKQRLALLMKWGDPVAQPNIAEELETSELDGIGVQVLDETRIDEGSRSDWMERSRQALDYAMQLAPKGGGPWPGASDANYPLLATAAGQFNARAYPAVVVDRNVVKGTIFGPDKGTPEIDPATGLPAVGQDGQPVWKEPPGARRQRADRIGEHMSWQKLKEQPEWEEETDLLLQVLPIVGSGFRKSWRDMAEGRNTSAFVFPDKLIINYHAKSLYTAPRVTELIELYPYEVEEKIRSGEFLDIDYGPPDGATHDPSAPMEFYEQHRRLDLDGDDYEEPYIVTVHRLSGKVARIVARYDIDGIIASKSGEIVKVMAVQYYTPYKFFPNPDGGIYGVGYGQLLLPVNKQINATLNSLFDSGTLQNMGGGFIGSGLSMHAGSIRFKPGEYKLINAVGSTVRENVVPLTFPGPTAAMFQLLVFLVESGRELGSIKDILTGEKMAANTPATTILAMIEQGLKVFTAVYKRVHRSLAAEYQKDFRLNKIYMPEQSYYMVGEEVRLIERDDYLKGAGIEPVSDPKSVSDMQKLGRAEFLRTFLNDPYVNAIKIRQRIFEAAGIEKTEEILLDKPPPNPQLIHAAAKLQLEMIAVKAKALHEMAAAYKAMAEGDATAAGIGISFVTSQMEILRLTMEALDRDTEQEAADGEGGGPLAIPGLAGKPGNGLGAAVPPGPGRGVNQSAVAGMVAGNA